jgi:membrane fusion protein, heavy metal efflux system
MKNQFLTLLIIVFTLFSCKNELAETHDHENENVKRNLTAYSDRLEVFAEADPFVAGKTTTILAHFTQLSDFKPIPESSVTISLIVGTKGIRQTISETHTPGIYKFVLKPEAAGNARIIFDIKNKESEQQIVINDMEIYTDEHDAVHNAEKMIKEGINQISFTKEQSWKIEFETTMPEFKAFGEVIKTTAQFFPAQNDELIISSKTNGFIQFLGNITEGINISTGKNMAIIAGNELAENNTSVRFSEAQNNYELTKANFERSQKLEAEKIISEKELLQIKTDFENAKAAYENLKRNFNAQGQIIVSNSTGYIKKAFVSNGQFVESGQALFSVISNKNLLLKADVPQKYFSDLKNIQSATFKIPANNKIYTLEECNGTLISFGKSADLSDSYLIPVIFQIENKDEFIAGSFADIFIKTQSDKNLLIVPNSSLVEEMGNYFVFVQITPELFEKRQVKTGMTDGLFIEILQGIDISERIVSKGAVIVKLAAVSNTLDPHAGHVH